MFFLILHICSNIENQLKTHQDSLKNVHTFTKLFTVTISKHIHRQKHVEWYKTGEENSHICSSPVSSKQMELLMQVPLVSDMIQFYEKNKTKD